MSVKDKVALVTGATGALGSVTSRRFHAAGARLVLCDLSADRLHALREEFGDDPPCLQERTDVTDATQVEALIERALDAFGRIDILLNIAGGYRAGSVVETSEADLDLALALNLKSVFLMCRAVVPHMIAQRWGRIINIGARTGLQGRAGSSAHAISKGGVILLTESLADEVRDQGVTANVLIPSTIDTPANRQAWPQADFSKWVPPEHLAEVMLFLCSEKAQSISGARITVFNRS